jgi:HSP20 family protein
MPGEPFDPLHDEVAGLRRRLRHVMEQALAGAVPDLGAEGGQRRPRADLYLTPDEVVLEVELPGVAKADVQISVVQDSVTIRGEVKPVEQTTERQYIHEERPRGPFSRQVAMPVAIDPEGTRASMADGVLTIHAPKQAAGEQARRIEIA